MPPRRIRNIPQLALIVDQNIHLVVGALTVQGHKGDAMSRTAEALRMKKAYLEGYYATDLSECKYKYGGETWHAWMDGWESGKSECQETP